MITVADYLARAMELSGRSQREIATEVGFPHPNVLSMMKQGLTKVPVERAPALARALRVDPAHFVRLVMREYMPAAWAAIEATLGETLTENERRLIEAWREICADGEREVDEKAVAALQRALPRQR
jgi:transcriptional regulator with XRE-family HTH domain